MCGNGRVTACKMASGCLRTLLRSGYLTVVDVIQLSVIDLPMSNHLFDSMQTVRWHADAANVEHHDLPRMRQIWLMWGVFLCIDTDILWWPFWKLDLVPPGCWARGTRRPLHMTGRRAFAAADTGFRCALCRKVCAQYARCSCCRIQQVLPPPYASLGQRDDFHDRENAAAVWDEWAQVCNNRSISDDDSMISVSDDDSMMTPEFETQSECKLRLSTSLFEGYPLAGVFVLVLGSGYLTQSVPELSCTNSWMADMLPGLWIYQKGMGPVAAVRLASDWRHMDAVLSSVRAPEFFKQYRVKFLLGPVLNVLIKTRFLRIIDVIRLRCTNLDMRIMCVPVDDILWNMHAYVRNIMDSSLML